MLSSKSRYIGAETASSVKTSEVGVITAATDRMSTTECFLYRLMNVAERKPSLANIEVIIDYCEAIFGIIECFPS